MTASPGNDRMPLIDRLVALARGLSARSDRARGSTLAEYSLLVALVALTCVAALTALGQRISDVFSSVAAAL